MKKLISAFHKNPSPANRAKLQTYLNKHPFAVCMVLPDVIAYLKIHQFDL